MTIAQPDTGVRQMVPRRKRILKPKKLEYAMTISRSNRRQNATREGMSDGAHSRLVVKTGCDDERAAAAAPARGAGGGLRKAEAAPDLICLSHLRWDFVFQRPQHLLTRFAEHGRVFFVEEPIYGQGEGLVISKREHGLHVVTPRLAAPLREEETHARLRVLINQLVAEHALSDYLLWFYTPMALPFTNHLAPHLVIYDCMDELSAFAGAPPAMREREAQLMSWADLVFTGGMSLYESKRDRHPHVHAFPSSIDQPHFARARGRIEEPEDQRLIPVPRIGFFGVVDERFDIALLDALARARPEWHFVILGPVVKIDPQTLPRHPNLHYLGKRDYAQLPNYLAGWDVAMLPFAQNESTRFISPTKTPEYLAAGRPVVSTPIADVVHPYGDLGLVHIADGAEAFASAIAAALRQADDPVWRRSVDDFLSHTSWDRTWSGMGRLMVQALRGKGQGQAFWPLLVVD